MSGFIEPRFKDLWPSGSKSVLYTHIPHIPGLGFQNRVFQFDPTLIFFESWRTLTGKPMLYSFLEKNKAKLGITPTIRERLINRVTRHKKSGCWNFLSAFISTCLYTSTNWVTAFNRGIIWRLYNIAQFYSEILIKALLWCEVRLTCKVQNQQVKLLISINNASLTSRVSDKI